MLFRRNLCSPTLTQGKSPPKMVGEVSGLRNHKGQRGDVNFMRLASALFLICAALYLAPVHGQDFREGTPAGETAQIQAILNRALEAAADIEDPDKQANTLSSIAGLQARAGNTQAALATASAIANDWQRKNALMRIASGQADAGDPQGGRETAARIDNDMLRDQALAEMARRLAADGQMDEALEIADTMTSEARKAEALAFIAMARAGRKDWVGADYTFEQARQAAVAVDNDAEKVRALTQIAEMQHLARNAIGTVRTLDLAQATLEKMEPGLGRDNLLAELARIQARAGLVGEAFQTTEKIREERWQRWALMGIAEAQAESGDLQTASSTIGMIPDPPGEEYSDKTFALSIVAQQQSNAGAFHEAIETVSRMPPGHSQRAHTLASIAFAQAWRGDTTDAQRTFRQALEETSLIEDAAMREQATRIVAGLLARAGNTSDALQAARTIQIEHERSNAFSVIAHSQARRGDAPGALRWIAELDSPLLRASALLAVADARLGKLKLQKARSRNGRR